MTKYSILFLSVLVFGCAAEGLAPPLPADPTFEQITPNPRLVRTVAGCWFDNETLVYRGETVENMCSVRARGEEISCRDLCVPSAFNVYNMCDSVSRCTALLWVGSENPLENERGCWNCVDGCFDSLDRTPESFEACRSLEVMLEPPEG